MAGIRLRDNEINNVDSAIRRFKRAVEKSGTLSEMRKREFFVKRCDIRKRAKAAAIKRQQKRNRQDVNPAGSGDRTSTRH